MTTEKIFNVVTNNNVLRVEDETKVYDKDLFLFEIKAGYISNKDIKISTEIVKNVVVKKYDFVSIKYNTVDGEIEIKIDLKQKEKTSNFVKPNDPEQLNTMAKNLINFVLNAERKITECNDRINLLEKYILDIYHMIELGNLNGPETSKQAKLLKRVLKLRRTYKDSLFYYKTVIETLNISNVENFADKIYDRDKILQNRVYSKRISDVQAENIRQEIEDNE